MVKLEEVALALRDLVRNTCLSNGANMVSARLVNGVLKIPTYKARLSIMKVFYEAHPHFRPFLRGRRMTVTKLCREFPLLLTFCAHSSGNTNKDALLAHEPRSVAEQQRALAQFELQREKRGKHTTDKGGLIRCFLIWDNHGNVLNQPHSCCGNRE